MIRNGYLRLLIVLAGLLAASCSTDEAPSVLATTTVPASSAAANSSTTSTTPTTEAPVASSTTTGTQPPSVDQADKPILQIRFEERVTPDEWQCVTDYVATSTPDNGAIALGLVTCAPETISDLLTLEAEQEGLIPPIWDVSCLFDIADDDGLQRAAASQLLLSKAREIQPELFTAYRKAAPVCTPGWLLGDIAEAYVPLSVLGFEPSLLAQSTDPNCLAEVSQGPEAAPVWDSLFTQLTEGRVDWDDPELQAIQIAVLDCVNAGTGIDAIASTGLELSDESLTCLGDSFDGILLFESTDPTLETIDRIEAIATSCLSQDDLEQLQIPFALELTRFGLEDER